MTFSNPDLFVATATLFVGGLSLSSVAALRGWQGWLDLKRLEISSSPRAKTGVPPHARTEIAILKDRIKRLEAIASGVEQ